MLLPEPSDRDEGRLAAKQLYTKGNMEPLCEFVEQGFFQVFRNRDYIWANKHTVKTAFLTHLYNDIFYIMDSEKETGRGYADLTMIIRSDMRRFKTLPRMRAKMEEAKNQVEQYGNALEEKYVNLRLKRYGVVSLGFERLWWESF